MNDFREEVAGRVLANRSDLDLCRTAAQFTIASIRAKYSYNFSWLGRPVIQYPQDIVAIQELIWAIRPDLIIETGIAHGGSLILSASMLAILDMCDAIETGEAFDPSHSRRKVIGIDIDIRARNRLAVEAHPMASRIRMIEGSSIAPEVIKEVKTLAASHSQILICLDSNHTHDHVFAELQAYASLTSKGSYCIVFDTIIEDLPEELFVDRSWGPGNNPKTAVREFLKSHPEFEIDTSIQNKLLATVAPDGYLKKIA
jgi:cephalosporin hydroxylase